MKISYKEKDGMTVYRVDRKIVCFRTGKTYCIGKPSDRTTFDTEAVSEEKAHEHCIVLCQDYVDAIMRYNNPVAYHAHKIINSLKTLL